MESELTLHSTSESQSSKAVVFLHGVNGDWRDTWTNKASGLFWPQALGELAGWASYSIQYDANTNWGRTTMPLQERAVSVAEMLLSAPQLAGKEIALIVHSFGGVVAKQMLRHAHDRDRYRDLLERLAGLVFVATPHTGADIATYGHFLRWALGSAVTLEDLRAHSPLLAIPAKLARYPRQAAAVCYRKGPGGVEFLLVRNAQGTRWTFPKGGIEQRLGIAGSAVQEALEEAGVSGTIEPKPFTYYLHAKRELKPTEDRATKFCIAAFLMKVVNEKARSPEPNRSPSWFSPNDAKLRLSEDRSVIYRTEFERVIDEAMRYLGEG